MASFLDMLNADGRNPGGVFQTDEQAFSYLMGLMDQYQQDQPYIEAGRQMYSQGQQGQAVHQSHQPNAPQPQPRFRKINIDPTWDYVTYLDDDGVRQPVNPSYQKQADDYNEALAQQQQQAREILLDPEGYFQEMMQAHVQPMLEQRLSGYVHQDMIAEQQRVQAAMQQQYQMISSMEEAGLIKFDPTGQPELVRENPRLAAYEAYCEHLHAKGVADPQAMHELALDYARGLADNQLSYFMPEGQQPPKQQAPPSMAVELTDYSDEHYPTPDQNSSNQRRDTFLGQQHMEIVDPPESIPTGIPATAEPGLLMEPDIDNIANEVMAEGGSANT